MATAELAVAIPSLIAALLLLLAVVDGVRTQVLCEHAARAAVRMVARGDDPGAALEMARRLGPPGADVTIAAQPEVIEVRVQAAPRTAGLLGLSTRLHATSAAVREDVAP